jgi:hypothetical protein
MRLAYRDAKVKNRIALFLDNTNEIKPKAFRCTGCGFIAFQYYSDQRMMVAGQGPITETDTPTVTVQCGNGSCKLMYDIYR